MKSHRLQAEIIKLNDTVQNLSKITMEQVQVILDLANKLNRYIV